MNRTSPLTRYIVRVLALQRSGKTMKWIVAKVEECKAFKNVSHRQIWNSCWNGTIYPTEKPRFKVFFTEGETLFIANREK